MPRRSVNSSNLWSVGYEGSTLEIEFHHGGIYQYYGVPYDRYAGLMNASSPGGYHHRYIKHNFRYRRVG